MCVKKSNAIATTANYILHDKLYIITL